MSRRERRKIVRVRFSCLVEEGIDDHPGNTLWMELEGGSPLRYELELAIPGAFSDGDVRDLLSRMVPFFLERARKDMMETFPRIRKRVLEWNVSWRLLRKGEAKAEARLQRLLRGF